MQSTSMNGSSTRSRHATVSWRHGLLRIICRQRAVFRSRHSASAQELHLSFSARTGSLSCDLECGVRDPTSLFDTILTSVYIAYTDRYTLAFARAAVVGCGEERSRW